MKFEGWEWVAAQEQTLGRRAEARAAYEETWKHVDKNRRVGWGPVVVRVFFEDRADLSRKERRFATDVAAQVMDQVEKNRRQAASSGAAPPASNDDLVSAYTTLAYAHALNRKKSKAVAMLDKALELQPGNVDIEELKQRVEAL